MCKTRNSNLLASEDSKITYDSHGDDPVDGRALNESTFSPSMPWVVSTVTTIGILVAALTDWLLKGEGSERQVEDLPSSMASAGTYIAANGWSIIAVSVSLLAISVTAVSIIGLDNFEGLNSSRRHELILSLSGTFVNAAICLLSALVTGTVFSELSVLLSSSTSSSAMFLLLLGVSFVLWLCAKSTHAKLRDVAQSDHDARLREKINIKNQLMHYEALYRSAVKPLDRRKVNLRVEFARQTFATLSYSILFLVCASLAAGILVWVPQIGGNYTGDSSEWQRSYRVFFGALGLSATIMVLSSLPFMMSTDYLKTRESGWRAMVVAFISIIVACLLPMVAIGAAGWGVFSGFEEPPGWSNFILFALVVAPTVVAIFAPLKHSWLVLVNVSAAHQLKSKMNPLKARLNEIDSTE